MIKIKFNTKFKGLKETAPIQPATRFIPEWFQKLPLQYVEDVKAPDLKKGVPFSSTRLCPGFVEYFKRGYVIPMWSDLLIKVTRKGDEVKWFWNFSDNDYEVQIHNHEQFLNFAPPHAQKNIHQIFKIICPWTVELPKGYSLYQLPMHYYYNPNFHVLPGIFPSDTYAELNQQLCVTKLGEFVIERGTPIGHYVPFKREDFKHELLYNDKEMNEKFEITNRQINSKFARRWRNAQNL